MSNERPTSPDAGNPKLPPWLVVVLVIAFLGVTWWQNNLSPKPIQPIPPSDTSAVSDSDQTRSVDSHPPQPSASETQSESDDGDSSLKIENQTIHDQSGHVVFQGTIDLAPTMARIQRGDSNQHRNDGTIFQNREQRLPRKPGGYYKEYVHPTPHERGPGPQRVIIGREGEIWYTPDHYKTFKQIKLGKG